MAKLPPKPKNAPPPVVKSLPNAADSAQPVLPVIEQWRAKLYELANSDNVVVLQVPDIQGGEDVLITIEVEDALLFVDGRGVRLGWNGARNCLVYTAGKINRPTASLIIGRKHGAIITKHTRTTYLDGDRTNLVYSNMSFVKGEFRGDVKYDEKGERVWPEPKQVGEKWRVCFYMGGKQIQRRFDTKQEAIDFRIKSLQDGVVVKSKRELVAKIIDPKASE